MAPQRLFAPSFYAAACALRQHAVGFYHRTFHGYGRHDAELLGRFAVPVHRTDAELRSVLLGGAR